MNTFKLGLCAMAVCSAFAANAANVTLYGSVSTGVVVTGTDKIGGADRTTSTAMESAWYGDSIWGLSGEEELGNGWKVSFNLESEFGSDSGQLAGAEDGKLFDSQTYLAVGNDFVTVAAGNIGAIDGAGGDFDLVGGFDPMEAAFGVGGMGAFASRDLAFDNNLVISLTPVEGLTVNAMAAFGDDSEPAWSKRDHYYGIGALYENGPLAIGATASMQQFDGVEDKSCIYTLGASYDFESFKPIFMYQHADKNASFQDFDFNGQNFDADSVLVGLTAPLGNGTLMTSLQHVTVKADDVIANGEKKAEATIFGVAYNYELSKRTSVYAGAVYAKGDKALDKSFVSGNDDFDAIRGAYNGWQAGIGLNHAF